MKFLKKVSVLFAVVTFSVVLFGAPETYGAKKNVFERIRIFLKGKKAPAPKKPPPKAAPEVLPVAHGEVFVGPLAGWKDAKKDYKAVGDGIADDTAALQNALNDLRQVAYPVLYIPSGTYRITGTLTLPRDDKNLLRGVKIVGEDPAITKIVWDGPVGGSMFFLNFDASSLGRLTFDGKGKARIILEHGPEFSFFTEYFDLVLQDAGICLEAGKIDKFGISDAIIIRTTFLRCSLAGVFVNNPNSLQLEIHDSLFKDNFIGITNLLYLPQKMFDLQFKGKGYTQGVEDPDKDNFLVGGAGNYHVYQSVFMNSTLTDTAVGYAQFFTIRDSISLGSNAFHLSTGTISPAPVTLQRNVILDPKGQISTANYFFGGCGETMNPNRFAPICIGNAGSLTLLDNVIRARDDYSGPLVHDASWATPFISMGNTYTVKEWFGKTHPNLGESKLRSIHDKVVDRNAIADIIPALPPTPPKINPPLFEIPPGADAMKIQKAIDEAVKFTGQKPVVHLQVGTYPIDQTIVIPPNTDVQILGEGFQLYTASILQWVGKGKGPVMRIDGPSKAVVRSVNIWGKKRAYDGLVLAGIDQPQGRVWGNLLMPFDSNIGFFLNKLKSVSVEFIHTWPAGSDEIGAMIAYKVVGPGSGQPGAPILMMGEGGFGDVVYDVQDAQVLVRDAWTESRAWSTSKYVRLRGDTTFTLHNFFQDHPRAGSENVTILVDSINGKASFIGGLYNASELGDPRIPKGFTVPDSFLDWGDPGFESTPTIIVQGSNPTMKVAAIGSLVEGQTEQTFLQNKASAGEVGQVYVHAKNKNGNEFQLLNDLGQSDDAFLLEAFEQTRKYGPLSHTPTAPGVSDIVLHRVYVRDADTGITFAPSYCGNKIVEAGEQCDDGKVSEFCPYGETSACELCPDCTGYKSGKTTYCGDKVCDLKHESSTSCSQDCGAACPSENLVGWWPAEGNAQDALGRNHGEIKGDTAFTPGVVGEAFSFDGAGDFVTMGDPFDGSLDMGTDDFTVVFWMKKRDESNEYIVSKGCADCGGVGYGVMVGDVGTSPYFLLDGEPDGGNPYFGFNPGTSLLEWHHIAGVFDRDDVLTMYFDGEPKHTADISFQSGSASNDDPFVIGALLANSGFLKGTVDEVAVWRSALSASEIQAIYQTGGKGMCKP